MNSEVYAFVVVAMYGHAPLTMVGGAPHRLALPVVLAGRGLSGHSAARALPPARPAPSPVSAPLIVASSV